MVAAQQNASKPFWFIPGAAGQTALVRDGKVFILDAPAGMPKLDRQSPDVLLRELRQSPHEPFRASIPASTLAGAVTGRF
jgi:hypothetical protein